MIKYSGEMSTYASSWLPFARSIVNQALTDDDIRREWNRLQDPVKLVRAVLGKEAKDNTGG